MSRAKLVQERACRRERRWIHVCDVYKQVEVPDPDSIEITAFTYTLLYADQKFVLKETPEMDLPNPIGATKEFNILTSDVVGFSVVNGEGTVLKIKSGYALVLKTPSHPAYGKCWMIEGNAKEIVEENMQNFYARRSPAPDGVPYDLTE